MFYRVGICCESACLNCQWFSLGMGDEVVTIVVVMNWVVQSMSLLIGFIQVWNHRDWEYREKREKKCWQKLIR